MAIKDEIITKAKKIKNTAFEVVNTESVPTLDNKQLTFGCKGLQFKATVLYIDMRGSTKLFDAHQKRGIAKLHNIHNIKKITTLLFCLVITSASISAQSDYKPATETQKKEMMQKITEASEQLKTLRCDFVQKKTISILSDEMVSEGKMSFKQTNKLKWEYTKPYLYEFVMNGDKVMMNSGNTKNVIDVNSSKVFREISKIIVSGINGSGIFDTSKFTAQFKVGAKDNMVILMPKQKELKQMFSAIRLRFNKLDYTVNSVEIEEINGDVTHIEMKNKQINKELSDEVFTIR